MTYVDTRPSTPTSLLSFPPRSARREGCLDLILPAHNEEKRIGSTLFSLAQIITCQRLPVRIVVVDNNSVDTTAAIVDGFARDSEVDIEVISCARRGKGAAVRAGVVHSTAEWVGFCDADLPVPEEALTWALSLLRSGWDVVVGSRRCAGATYERDQPFARKVGGSAYRLASARLRGRIADTQCGFKFFNWETADRLFDAAQIDGYSFDLEIMSRAQQMKGVRLIEMPVPWSDRDGSSFRAAADGVQAFADLRRAHRSLHEWTRAENFL